MQIYGPKAAGAWPTGVSIVGPAGATVPAGAQGPAGPAGADGATGPAGAQGPAGPAGADGAAGPAGPAGRRKVRSVPPARKVRLARQVRRSCGRNGRTRSGGSRRSAGCYGRDRCARVPPARPGPQGPQGPAGSALPPQQSSRPRTPTTRCSSTDLHGAVQLQRRREDRDAARRRRGQHGSDLRDQADRLVERATCRPSKAARIALNSATEAITRAIQRSDCGTAFPSTTDSQRASLRSPLHDARTDEGSTFDTCGRFFACCGTRCLIHSLRSKESHMRKSADGRHVRAGRGRLPRRSPAPSSARARPAPSSSTCRSPTRSVLPSRGSPNAASRSAARTWAAGRPSTAPTTTRAARRWPRS